MQSLEGKQNSMWQVIAILPIFLLISSVSKLIVTVLVFALFAVLSVILFMLAITIAFSIIRAIYHFFNPKAKEKFKIRQEKERVEQKAKKDKEEAVQRQKEFEHRQHRDAEKQSTPYTYMIGKHGNESLAIRYGIANQERKTKEYWYYAKGGVKQRNSARDRVYYEPSTSIRIQKTKKISTDLYEVLLTDYRNRKARAVIEVGTEYVKTFYPLDDVWFKKYAALEETLKGNGTFSLKELATFHVQKTVDS
jgi:hypothetical protein